MSDSLPCPRCGRDTSPRWTDTDQRARTYFYKCTGCRNHFRAVRLPGLPLQVTNQSAPESRTLPTIGMMGCPECGAYGKIRVSQRREDGYWRRHQCMSHGPYHTCETEDGISIHKKMKALHPIDNN